MLCLFLSYNSINPPLLYLKRQIIIMHNGLVTDDLYQLPNCSICLQQLTEDLASLACGHIFHISCITQHFQYKGSCPNCQKRAYLKEIRLVVFPVIKNTQSSAHLRNLLANFNGTQQQQVKSLLEQVKNLSEKADKYQNDCNEYQKETKKHKMEVQQLKSDIEGKKTQINILSKENKSINKQNSSLLLQNEKNHAQLIDMQIKLDQLLDQKKQFQQFKILQRMAQNSSEQLLKYRKQLQDKKTPPQAVAKQFLQMLQIKNLNILKHKQKQKDLFNKWKTAENQNTKIKNNNKILKQQVMQAEKDKEKLKKKLDELRVKYKELAEKYKSRNCENSDIQQMQDSLSISMSMKFGLVKNPISKQVVEVKQIKKPSFNVVQKPKVQSKLSFGNTNLKKKADQQNRSAGKNSIKNFMMG